MFKGRQFYHEHIRKAIIAFGTIFNNIRVVRKNASDEAIQELVVPLAYSTKQRFLTRMEQVPTVDSKGETAIVLPRMGFEITSLNYDPTRKVAVTRQHVKTQSSEAAKVSQSLVSTPYDLSLQLSIYAKNQSDGLQILEQVLPYFNPDFNITVNDLPEMGITRDIKIVLNDVAFEENSYGSFLDRQTLIWTLNFTMKLNFYGYVGEQEIIRRSIASIYQQEDLTGENVKQTFTVSDATATATASIDSGSVDTITLTYAGTGYKRTPNITISGNARAHAEMTSKGDSINNIVIDDAGSGYSSAPTVTIDSPDDGVQTIDDAYRFLEEFEIEYE